MISEIERRAPAADNWTPPELSVIVPTFRERDNIASLYDKLAAALSGVSWEMIVVDDNSPDGTSDVARGLARQHPNVRAIQRIGRRGLSSACMEGAGASAAPYVAVIDADHQHDETKLSQMLALAVAGDDIVVGSRYAGEGSTGGGLSSTREAGSRLATRLSNAFTRTAISDPMSGFFLMKRDLFEEVAPTLSREGFKILLDIVVSATQLRRSQGRELKVGEVPYVFRPRNAGESKMSSIIVVQFLGLLVSKMLRGLVPVSFLMFSVVGGIGIVVHLIVLWITHEQMSFNFTNAQLAATFVAMTTNFVLNNELTYADKKLRGFKYLTGLLSFYVVCSIGALANVSVAAWIYQADTNLLLAGFAGALMSLVFNYSVTKVFTWR